MLAVDVNLK